MTSSKGARRRRGEPLAALALLLTGWTGARMLLWESPFASAFPPAVAAPANIARTELPPAKIEFPSAQNIAVFAAYPAVSHPRLVVHWPRKTAWAEAGVPTGWSNLATTVSEAEDVQHPMQRTAKADTGFAFAVPPGIAPLPPREGRWHFDSWIAWRAGSGLSSVASGARAASYGGTQAGAVARFYLEAGSRAPALYLRATYAPDRPRQGELAAGAGVRPVAGLPVRLMAEIRATRAEGQTEVRPAALAVTELAPIALPFGLTAEGYAQAGWVGGRYATAFADGQARVTRAVAKVGPARVRIGAGAWGGAQKFAERVDVGPTVALDLASGPVAARLSFDYRVQVAGHAAPGDGLALTLSTGF